MEFCKFNFLSLTLQMNNKINIYTMKHRYFIYFLFLVGFMLLPSAAIAQKEYQAQIKYVLRHLRITKEKKAELTPILTSYYEEIKEVKAPRAELRRELGAKEKKGDLSPSECNELFASKIKQEHAELDVREKYFEEFKKILTVQQAYTAIRLANDKVSDYD